MKSAWIAALWEKKSSADARPKAGRRSIWPGLQTSQTALAHADRAQHEERGFKACRWPDPNRIANMGKEGKLVLTKDKTRAD